MCSNKCDLTPHELRIIELYHSLSPRSKKRIDETIAFELHEENEECMERRKQLKVMVFKKFLNK